MSDAPLDPSHETRRNERIARNVLFLAGGQVFSTILGLVLTSTLGRMLGPADFGIYYIILTITGFIAVFVDWGQQTYVVKEVARGRSNQAEFLTSAAVIRTVIAFAAAALAPILALAIGYPAIVVWLTPLAVLSSLPATHALLLGHFFRGRDRMELDVTSGLIQKFLAVLATVAALLLGGGVEAAVLVPIIGGLAGLAFCVLVARRLGVAFATPRRDTMREAIGAGAAIVVMTLSVSVHPLLDVTMLSVLTTPTVVGWLGAARAIIGILLAPALILATASFADLCRAAHSPPDLRQVVSASSRLLVTVGALGFCGLYSFADQAVALIYGAGHFDPAVTVLKVCAPFFPLFFVNFLIGNTALAMGKSVEIAVAKSATVAISVIVGWFLIGIFQERMGNGAVGVMIAYCGTELLMTMAYVFILPRGVLDRTVWTQMARAYGAAVVVCLLATQFVTALPLWLSLPLFLGVYLVVALAMRLLRVDDLVVAVGLARSTLTGSRKVTT